MKRKHWILIAVLVGLAVGAGFLFSWAKGVYNHLVVLHQAAETQWADLQAQYQRRADLIPNLVETVRANAEHERLTLQGVTEARAQATQVKLNFNDLNQEALNEFSQKQSELSSALSRLLVASERYPELKANRGFIDLQTQLEGTENRIATERRRYNEVVQAYNVSVRQFPYNLVAGMFDFEPMAFFMAESGAEKAPEVKF